MPVSNPCNNATCIVDVRLVRGELGYGAWLLMQRSMPADIPHKQVMLLFTSIASISAFKKEGTCYDFYIDRDTLTLVGSFTQEQVAIAREKYNAQAAVVNI